nr:HalOD1 output domain-containing protein [Natronorubrum sulfidifaciens]
MTDPLIGSTDGEFDSSVSMAIVTAVASERGVSPTELPPLYEWINPDALDALFEPTRSSGPRHGHLEFTYDGHEIVLECDGTLEITIDGTRVIHQRRPTTAESAGV